MRALTLLALWICSSQARQLTCPLSLLIPFHDSRTPNNDASGISESYSPTVVSLEDRQRDGITLLATALMAIEDFNNRNSSQIPQLSEYQDCNVFYPDPIVIDSGRDADRVTATKDEWLMPTSCAVMGPIDNLAAQAASQAVIGTNVPSVSYGAQATILANATLFPNSALGYVSWDEIVLKMTNYMVAKRRYTVGVMYTPGDNLDYAEFVDAFESARQRTGLGVTISVVWTRTEETFQARLQKLKDEGRKTIVVALQRDDNVDVLSKVADRLGMLSPEYMWVFLDTFVSPQYVSSFNASVSSPELVKLLSHSHIMQLLDGLVPLRSEEDTSIANAAFNADRFQDEWRERGALLVDNVNEYFSSNSGLDTVGAPIEADFFVKNSPAYGSGYLYDAIMSMGMSVCAAGSPLDLQHKGPSGTYRYIGRSLDSDPLEFGMFTVQLHNGTFEALLQDFTAAGLWEEGDTPDNYYDTWVTVVVLALAILSILYAMGSCYFVYYYRKNRIVSVGQPEFLYILCFGASLVAMSVILLAFDEEDGWSQAMLDAKCVVAMWLGNLGVLIVYMALFSKLWRVAKVMQMRRGQQIQVRHVIGPFALVVTASVGVMFAYTFVDGPSWRRGYFLDDDDAFEDYLDEGTVGYCDNSPVFSTIIELLLAVVVIIALWQSCKTKDLPEDISDSRRVCQTLTAHLIIIIIGFFLMVAAYAAANVNITLLSHVLTHVCLSVTSVGFLVWPKMYYVYTFKKTGQYPEGLQRGRTTVSGISVPGQSASSFPSSMPASHVSIGALRISGASVNAQSELENSRSPMDSQYNASRSSSGFDTSNKGHGSVDHTLNEAPESLQQQSRSARVTERTNNHSLSGVQESPQLESHVEGVAHQSNEQTHHSLAQVAKVRDEEAQPEEEAHESDQSLDGVPELPN